MEMEPRNKTSNRRRSGGEADVDLRASNGLFTQTGYVLSLKKGASVLRCPLLGARQVWVEVVLTRSTQEARGEGGGRQAERGKA